LVPALPRVPVPELRTNRHGPLLPAALAFLALAVASGSFVSFAYRLRRDGIEV